jgi:hypothetical protein
MAISASGQGGALVRVNPDESSALIATATASEAVMGGRAMPGWLRVSADQLETDQQLAEWVSRAVAYARSLPPKRERMRDRPPGRSQLTAAASDYRSGARSWRRQVGGRGRDSADGGATWAC